MNTLFAAVAERLLPRGIFLITYRELTSPLTDTDRFIPVRCEERRIMTCVLEYDNDETVLVTDLIHVRGESGWMLGKSSYRKLRLSKEWMSTALTNAGFTSQSHDAAGRLSLVVASIE